MLPASNSAEQVIEMEEIFTCYFDAVKISEQCKLYMQRQNVTHKFSSGYDDGWSDRFIANEVLSLNVRHAKTLLNALSADDTVLDIGAHKGYFTVHISPHVTRVVAFEPDAFNVFILKKNLLLNNVSNVVVEQKAVWSNSATKTLYRSGLSPASHSLFPSQFIGEVKPIQVECTTLEDIFRKYNIEDCGLVKMDCEGSEYEILFGAPLPILRRVRTFQVELHENEQLQYTFEHAVSFFKTCGFSVDVYGYRAPTSNFKVCMVLAQRVESTR